MKGNVGFEIAVRIDLQLIACLRVERACAGLRIDIQDQNRLGRIAWLLKNIEVGNVRSRVQIWRVVVMYTSLLLPLMLPRNRNRWQNSPCQQVAAKDQVRLRK